MRFVSGKGFVYGPEPEIYGGLAGFYTYGPLGALLKKNVEDAIRSVFTHHELFEVECPIIMPRKVWEASGHLGNFTDPLISCTKCEAVFRLDHLVEENLEIQTDGKSSAELMALVKQHGLTCSSCGGALASEAKDHTLMMRTTIGVDTEAYNRPETATTTYLPFKNYFRFFREKLPFGVFQIGKAFRNEISPRHFIVRGREFTQAEGQLFLYEDQKNSFEKYEEIKHLKVPLWTEEEQKAGKPHLLRTLEEALAAGLVKSQAYAWTLHLAYELFYRMGVPRDHIRIRQHHSDEKAFYALDAWDIEVKTRSFGWIECAGVHDRGDYDLKQHEKHSGQELKAQDNEHKKQTPHILEIAFGTDRPVFALMDLCYSPKEENKDRDLFKVPYRLAPIQVAVLPLVNKLEVEAKHAHKLLKAHLVTWYDKSGSVGRRYARMDEIGVPYSVTIDFDVQKNNTVTVRDRDSTKQVRVPMERLAETLEKLLSGDLDFENAGRPVEEKK